MRLRSTRSFCLVALTVLGAACSDAPAAKDPQVHALTLPPYAQNVRPAATTAVVVPALPDATCLLRPTEASETGPAVELHSADEGLVTFHFQPASASGTLQFSLSCQDAQGKTARVPIELRVVADAPAPERPRAKGAERPALTADRRAVASQAELVALGYPPRPDPLQAPSAYARWVEIVSRPSTRVAIRQTETNRRADWQTPNWAGYAVEGTGPYVAATGQWTVPSIQGEYVVNHPQSDYSSLWVGVGGFDVNGGDLWQGGTEQDVTCYYFRGCAGTFFPWIELLSVQSQVMFTGFDLWPGDYFGVTMWVGDAYGNPTLSGPYAWWYVDNVSGNGGQGIYSMDHEALSASFNGGSAEWVVERTSVPGGLPHLPNFGTVSILGAQTIDGTGTWRNYGDLSPIQLGMYNGTTELAYASQVDSSALDVTWLHYH
jgi:hypothetical protein